MAQNEDNGAALAAAVVFGGLIAGAVAIVAAIVMGIIAYTQPYSGWVFFVPFVALAGIGYGTAYLLDHERKRRCITALVAAVIGSAVFLICLHAIAADAPVLWNAGALLAVLGFFLLFAALPAVGVCFGIALSCTDLRAALLGETLVDIAALPPDLVEPIRPYLDGLVQHPPWRRFSLTGLFDSEAAERERYRISHDELMRLFDTVREVIAERERGCRREVELIQAQNERDATRARGAFLESLTADDRGLLEAQLYAAASSERNTTQLVSQNAELTRTLAQVRKENQELKHKFQSWVAYLRDRSQTGQEAAALATLLAVGEREIRIVAQGRGKKSKGTSHATR